MDPITQQQALATAGAGGDPVYVDDVFSTVLYDGNGGTQTITHGIDITGEGGMTWIKRRSGTADHMLFDTERGYSSTESKILYSNQNSAQLSISSYVNATTNGFVLNHSGNSTNDSSSNYVSWNFRKAKGFFDVVTYTGTGSEQSISHNLGAVPGMILIKCHSEAKDWSVYHRSLGATKNMHLNNTTVADTQTGVFNDTEPTATNFTVNTDGDVNKSGASYVAYLFAHYDARFGENGDEPITNCGTYSGTGSSDNFVNVGFEPQWLLIKCTSSEQNWVVVDNQRKFDYTEQAFLYPNATTADTETSGWIIPNPRGFTLKGTGALLNSSTEDYIYIAIRRSHKPAESAGQVFHRYVGVVGNGYAGSPEPQGLTMTFPPDLILGRRENYANGVTQDGYLHGARYTGSARAYLYGTGTFASNAGGAFHFDHFPDLHVGDHGGYNDSNMRGWFYTFKRAKGFYDTTIYRGTGSARTVSHNLGVTPELIICKSIDYSDGWAVYTAPTGSGKRLRLDGNHTASNNSGYWNDTDPASTVFTVGTDNATNGITYNYIAHLFASQPGISKIGSYTGNSSANIDIDCGFTNGARFVIVKRTDAQGDWFQWDSFQGIVDGNDPYFVINSTAGRVTNEDNIDPLSSGFRIPQGASQNLNWTGATYIFLAIA